MTLAREGEAAVERRLDPRRGASTRHPAGAEAQGVEEAGGGEHRAHRMRARWADADLEDVEDAEEHRVEP